MLLSGASGGFNWPSIMALLSVGVIVYTLIIDILFIFAGRFFALN